MNAASRISLTVSVLSRLWPTEWCIGCRKRKTDNPAGVAGKTLVCRATDPATLKRTTSTRAQNSAAASCLHLDVDVLSAVEIRGFRTRRPDRRASNGSRHKFACNRKLRKSQVIIPKTPGPRVISGQGGGVARTLVTIGCDDRRRRKNIFPPTPNLS